MSANLWSAENVISAEALEDGIYACSGMRGVRTNVSLDRLATNQTFHCGFSVNPGKDDKFNMALWYRDAAGNVDYAFSTNTSAPAGKWTRVSRSVVIPSGMTVYQMVICNNGNSSGSSRWKVTNPTLSLGSPVCLASSAHTPYATQDHVAAEYATKASLSVTAEAIKAEVAARTKTDKAVSDLSAKVTQTSNSLSTEVSDRKQAITTVTGLANAAQSTANGAVKQANIYSFGQGAAGAVPKWIHLGTLTSAYDAAIATIVVMFGNGNNGLARQNSSLTITIKDGWQATDSAVNACGVTVMRENCDDALVDVLAQSATVYDVWVYAPWAYSFGNYSVSGVYKSWQDSGATQKDEPATSDTQVKQDVAYRLADATKAQTMALENKSSITQLSDSITSLVEGEATYTAPDGTTKTSGIYSKIEQTASGINKTFGQYTKTADLASTAAVKDAKKAGTDAASAASAAQSTADAAKANAATAQSTANTAVTNAANAQSTANSAQSTADNLATLIHEGEDGITVGKSTDGKTFTQGRTHMGQSSFDVLDKNGTVVASLASGKVSLLGDDVSMTAYQDGRGFTDCEIHGETYMALSGGSLDTDSSTGNVGLGIVSASTAGASMSSHSDQESENSEVSVGDDGFARVYGRKGVAVSSDEGGMQLNGGTSILKVFAGTSVVKSLGSDFDLFSGNDCKSRFGELVMPDEHASWVLLASPGQGSYDHHITLSPTSRGGVHGYITPSITGNVRVQWLFIKF